ncbi:MAG: hypothetical protein K2Y32_17755 [Candidatus Obscuribacterales bacterium]|nr:hypothetical protein [Candidatus Obscuribacterales bacterium]
MADSEDKSSLPRRRWGLRFAAQEPPPGSKDTDSYFEKLIRYIPADIVAGYVALDGILKEGGNSPLWLTWAVFIALLSLTPLYVCYVKTEPPGIVSSKTFYWLASTLAFAVWVFALGGPFAATFAWYKPVYGSVLLILTTLTLPVFESIFYKGTPPSPPVVPPAAVGSLAQVPAQAPMQAPSQAPVAVVPPVAQTKGQSSGPQPIGLAEPSKEPSVDPSTGQNSTAEPGTPK